MKDSGSIGNNLEIRLNGRNEGPRVVVVDKSSNSLLVDGGGQSVNGNKQVGGNEVAVDQIYIFQCT
jgi:hypothetical protein